MPRKLAAPTLIWLGLAVACSSVGGTGDRIVCVSKQINEYMFAIGAQNVIVGRDLTSVYPDEIKKIPSVGYHRALSAEGIISMKPTLFLTDGNVGPDAVLEQLRKVGIPILVMKPGRSVDSAQLLMRQLGAKFHRERAADSIISRWNSELAAITRDSAALQGQYKPRVLIMHFGQIFNNYLAVNRGSPADEAIRLAGGTNAIDSVGGMTRLTPELIARAKPDVIIATDVGFDRVGSAEKFGELPGVSLTPAAKTHRIFRIDESEIMYFGPRTPATIRNLIQLFHTTAR